MASPPDTRLAGAEARLVAISGRLRGEVMPFAVDGIRIGRDASNDICLPDRALSRAHGSIGSTCGTWRMCHPALGGTVCQFVPVNQTVNSIIEPNR